MSWPNGSLALSASIQDGSRLGLGSSKVIPPTVSLTSPLICQVLTLLGGFKEVVADWDTPETSVSPTRLNL